MSAGAAGAGEPPSLGPVLLLAGALALFGFLTSLPAFLGPIGGAVAALAAELIRRAPSPDLRRLAPAPPLVALLVLAAVAPPVASAELVGGFAALALLVWIASDPASALGGVRRALPTLAIVGLVFAAALTLVASLPAAAYGPGTAGALAAVALILVGVALARANSARPATTATA
jgi:hypothetical protein